MQENHEKAGNSFMTGLATFIVDKRNLFFLITIIMLIFSAFSRNWVEVESDLAAYLPEDSQTRQALDVMEEQFTTYGSAEIMVANVTQAQAEELKDQIAGIKGVQGVEYDNTEDHYPLKPAQISLASAFLIGIPSFFLALEPNHEVVKGRFLRNVLSRAFPAALTAVILVGWSLLLADAFSISAEQSSTVAFFLYSIAAYLMLYRVCRPLTPWHAILFISMGAAFIAASVLFPSWFHIAPPEYGCALILSALAFVALPLEHALQMLFHPHAEWKRRAQKRTKRHA